VSAKHTPGPWMAEQDHKERWGVYCGAYSDETPLVAKGSRVWPMSEEDARLMAAAPDLLEALRRAVATLGSCSTDVLIPCWNDRPSDVAGRHWGVGEACGFCTARAAIAKAEGRS